MNAMNATVTYLVMFMGILASISKLPMCCILLQEVMSIICKQPHDMKQAISTDT